MHKTLRACLGAFYYSDSTGEQALAVADPVLVIHHTLIYLWLLKLWHLLEKRVLWAIWTQSGVWPEVFRELNGDCRLAHYSLLSKRQYVRDSDYSSAARF